MDNVAKVRLFDDLVLIINNKVDKIDGQKTSSLIGEIRREVKIEEWLKTKEILRREILG